MPNPSENRPTSENPSPTPTAYDDYDLPGEVNLDRTTFIGTSVDDLRRHAQNRTVTERSVELEADVADAFPDAATVNEALRAVMHAAKLLQEQQRQRRKATA